MKREVIELLREAEEHGWRVRLTKRGHWRLQHPTGGLVFAPSTPSDWRSVKNTAAHLRRATTRRVGQ
jgi:hypothetical protein